MVISSTISDLNCLFICPSLRFSTIERQALRDCLLFRDMGGFPKLFCIRDSYLDIKAREQGIECIYSKAKNISSWFDIGFYFYIKELIQKNNINVIHCYQIDYANTLSFALGAFPDIPLIFSINKLMKKRHKQFYKKLLLRRIDLVLTMNKTIRNSLEDCLPVKARKIHTIGAGLKFDEKLMGKAVEDEWRFCCYVPQYLTSVESMETVLSALKPLAQALSEYTMPVKKFKLVFLCKKKWDEYLIFHDLKALVEKEEVAHLVEFQETSDIISVLDTFQLFISIDLDESVLDYELHSVAKLVPVLIPRISGRVDLLENFPGIGESYMPKDAREMKDKCLKILVNKAFYDQNLLYQKSRLMDTHGINFYKVRAKTLYENLVEIRKRLIQVK